MPNSGSEKQRVVIVGAGGRLGAGLLREYSRFNHAQLETGDMEETKVDHSATEEALVTFSNPTTQTFSCKR